MLRVLPGGSPAGLGRAILLRLVTNVALRVPYTFLPELARTFDASLSSTGAALGAGEASGLVGPAIGHATDRWARRRSIRIGALVFAGGAAVMAGAPALWVLVLGGVALQVGKLTTDTAIAAWVADHIPFERRGRAVAVVESSWPLSLLVGAPLAGLVVVLVGMRGVYALSAVAGMVGAWLLVPGDDGVVPAVAEGVEPVGGGADAGGGRLPRRAVPLLAAILALSFSMQCVMVVSGAWLEDVAGLSPGLIGVAAVVLALSELAGTAGAAMLNDRIGKSRCVLLGGTVEAVGLVVLIGGGENVAVGFVAFAVVICGFEHALISTFPLVSELSVSRRATGFGAALAILTVSRSAGSVVGAAAYDAAGIARPATIALALLLAGLLVTAAAVRDPAVAPA